MARTVVFQTDFGPGGCGAMAGVVKGVDEDLCVFEHDSRIRPYDIRRAAYQLSAVVPYWPAGTVFVSVVDPEVGSGRRACVARLSGGCYVVTPDNGTLTMVADRIEEVREVDEARNRLPGSEDVHIFHGRDVFAYTAARLASGQIAFEDIGPSYPVSDVRRIALTNVATRIGCGWAEGGVYGLDIPYGSLRVDVPNRAFQSEAGFAYGDHYRARVSCDGRLLYEGVGVYERDFSRVDETDGFLCGDIQPGELQRLRFNTKGGFIQVYAPELLCDPASAVDYLVRFERIEGEGA